MLKTSSECRVCPECQVPATASLFPRWPMFIYELLLVSLANFCCECLILQLKAMWLVRIQHLINYLIIQLINIARAGCLHSCSIFMAHEKEWQEIFPKSLASLFLFLTHLKMKLGTPCLIFQNFSSLTGFSFFFFSFKMSWRKAQGPFKKNLCRGSHTFTLKITNNNF